MLKVKHSQLVLVDENRSVKHSEQNVRERASSIKEKGILQNIVVAKRDDDTYWLAAGEGRYRSVELLISEGVFDTDFEYPALLVEKKDVSLVRLIENGHRENLHPVDEFKAYQQAVDAGYTIDEISRAQGVTKQYINGRLRLANVADQVLEAYKAGEVHVKYIERLSAIEDKSIQLDVHREAGGQYYRLADLVNNHAYGTESPIWLFAGDDYIAAKGELEEDLFSHVEVDEEGRCGLVKDRLLMNRVALKKLKKEAASYQEWAFVECVLCSPETHIEKAYPDSTVLYARDQIERNKALLGVVIGFDDWGCVEIVNGLVKDESVAEKLLDATSDADAGSEEDFNSGTVERDEDGADETYSQSLLDDIRHARSLMVMSGFLDCPAAAADLSMFQFCESIFGRNKGVFGTVTKAINFVATTENCAYEKNADLTGGLIERIGAIDYEWMAHSTQAERFKAFCELPVQDKLEAYGIASALCMNRYANPCEGALSVAVGAANIDFRKYWTPNRDEFFKRISAKQLLKIGEGIFGSEWVERCSAMTRRDLSKVIYEAFVSGDLNAEQESFVSQFLPEFFFNM